MNKRIVFENGKGGIGVIIPAPDCGLTVDQIAKKDMPKGVPFKIVDAADIPADRTFRDAWTIGAKGVETDLVKAKAIAHDMRRAARSEKMAPLDLMVTIPTEAAGAEAKRENIRKEFAKIQIDIDAADNEETLASIVTF